MNFFKVREYLLLFPAIFALAMCCGEGQDILTCPELNAIVVGADGTYAFKDEEVYRLVEEGGRLVPAHDYPLPIQHDFPGAPSYIDAAFVCHGSIFLLKGENYWEFVDGALVKRGKIRKRFPCFKRGDIDAAYEGDKGRAVFIKKDRYCKFECKGGIIARGKVRPVFEDPNAALRYTNDKMFLFKNGRIYRINCKATRGRRVKRVNLKPKCEDC